MIEHHNISSFPVDISKFQEIEQAVREDKVIRVVIYCRVSTNYQEENGESLDTQEARARAYCQERGYFVVEVVREVFTGTLYRERPELSRVRKMFVDREIDKLVAYDIDRLSRNQIHTGIIYEEIAHYGGQIETVNGEFDDSPFGLFMRQALAFAAQIELEKIRERTTRHFQDRTEKGQLLGKGPAKYGYRWNAEKTAYIPDPDEAAVIRLIFYKFVVEEWSIGQICRYLDKEGVPIPSAKFKKMAGKRWPVNTVSRYLRDTAYSGQGYSHVFKNVRGKDGRHQAIRTNNPIPVGPDIIPPLVDPIMQQRAIARIPEANDFRQEPVDKEYYLLRNGFIFCARCQRRVSAHTERNKHYYICSSNSGHAGRMPGCNLVRTRSEVIDKAVWEYIEGLCKRIDEITRMFEGAIEHASASRDIVTIDTLLAQTEKRIRAALREKEIFDPDSLSYQDAVQKLVRYERERKQLLAEKEKALPLAQRAEAYRQEVHDFIQWLRQVGGDVQQASYQRKRDILRMLGIRIELDAKNEDKTPNYRIIVTLDEKTRYSKYECT